MATFRSFSRISSAARNSAIHASGSSKRLLHGTSARRAITNLEMPAMSPTMTEGGIAGWKKQEGETFTAGDVLLEIETDKATIDVEAQDDGVMGKILLPDGSKNIKVGKVIALLAEEGDDISNLEPPKEKEEAPVSAKKEEAAPPSPEPSKPAQTASQPPPHSSTPPKHSRTMFPSVHRLLIEHNVSDAEKIKGTGIRGMLTKGDVLAYLGKASTPTGTFKEVAPPTGQAEKAAEKKPEYKAPDGPALRRLIVSTMLQASIKARNAQALPQAIDFDSVIADYLPASPAPSTGEKLPTTRPTSKSTSDYFDGLL